MVPPIPFHCRLSLTWVFTCFNCPAMWHFSSYQSLQFFLRMIFPAVPLTIKKRRKISAVPISILSLFFLYQTQQLYDITSEDTLLEKVDPTICHAKNICFLHFLVCRFLLYWIYPITSSWTSMDHLKRIGVCLFTPSNPFSMLSICHPFPECIIFTVVSSPPFQQLALVV